MTIKTSTTIPESHRARRLGGGCTGDCPIGGCGRPATAWGAPALVDGYADACTRHAQEAVLDAIEEQLEDRVLHAEGSAS